MALESSLIKQAKSCFRLLDITGIEQIHYLFVEITIVNDDISVRMSCLQFPEMPNCRYVLIKQIKVVKPFGFVFNDQLCCPHFRSIGLLRPGKAIYVGSMFRD